MLLRKLEHLASRQTKKNSKGSLSLPIWIRHCYEWEPKIPLYKQNLWVLSSPSHPSREARVQVSLATESHREMGGPGRPWHRHVFLVVSLQLLLVAPWQDETAARALNFTRQDFLRAFVFGAGTSAYQVGRISKARASFVVHLLVQPLGGCLKRVLGLTSS